MENSKIPDLFCRTCLRNLEEVKYNIFMMTHLSKWLCLCTSLNIEENDGLPKYLCDLCFMKIEDFYKFRTMCIESANKFHEMYEKGQQHLNNNYTDIDMKDDITSSLEVETPLPKPNASRRTSRQYKEKKNQKCVIGARESKIKPEISDLCEVFLKETKIHKNDLEGEKNKYENDDNNDIEDVDYNTSDCEFENCSNKSNDTCQDEDNGDDICEYDNKKTKVKLSRKTARTENLKSLKVNTNSNYNDSEDKKKVREIFVCETCNKRFFKHERYVACVRSHKGLKPWVCSECKKEYRKKESLRNHLRYEHNANCEMYPCPSEGCNKIYKLRQSARVHYRRIHLKDLSRDPCNRERKFVCEQCGKAFKTMHALRQHNFTHTGLYPYKCDQCPRRCDTKFQLEVHMRRHKGIKNFVCSICGLKTITRRELRVHMNYHTREKTYTCQFCPYTSCSKGNVCRHEKIVHHGIRTHECSYCGRTFGKSETLKHHVMTHTGEKPHECKLCGRRFIQLSALKIHLKCHDRNATRKPKMTNVKPQPKCNDELSCSD